MYAAFFCARGYPEEECRQSRRVSVKYDEKLISTEIGILTSDYEKITIIIYIKRGKTMDKLRNVGIGE